MAMNFYTRLADYYEDVAKVLRGQADAASIFPNSSDVGGAREDVYLSFLKQHVPSRCNVFKGGFLYHFDGGESAQLDIVVTTDISPRYDFHNSDGNGKSFSPVEGSIGVVSVKSTIDKKQLFEALKNLSTIPPTDSLEGRLPDGIYVNYYDDWPYKVIYASNGIDGNTLLKHVTEYYTDHSEIPLNRRPNIIHVAGKYFILRVTEMISPLDSSGPAQVDYGVGNFVLQEHSADVTAISQVLLTLQTNALISAQITYDYSSVTNNMLQEILLRENSTKR